MPVFKPGSIDPIYGILATPGAWSLVPMPTSGDAWNDGAGHGVAGYALTALSATPTVAGDKDSNDDVIALAKAIAYRAGTGAPYTGYPAEIQTAIAYIIANGLAVGSEPQPGLAVARNVAAWVLAADMMNLAALNPSLDTAFRQWLAGPVRTTSFGGRTLIEIHEERPNNWGTHAGASRMAIARYLGDTVDFQRAVEVFKGWLGDRNAYAGFDWGELHWQADEDQPVGINPAGATKLDSAGVSRNIDGVLPDDQRRASGPAGTPPSFVWPPAKTNYVYEALQGVLLQAILVARAGRQNWGGVTWDPWAASGEAIRRAFEWLADPAKGNFPVDDAATGSGDDHWETHIVNAVYGTALVAPTVPRIGKAFGFADWLKLDPSWPTP